LCPISECCQGWPLKTLRNPKQVALHQARRLQQFADKSNGGLVLLRTRGDLANFLKRRQAGSHLVAAFLGTEGAQPLEGKLENLDTHCTQRGFA
jgi:membrane dipeptidase